LATAARESTPEIPNHADANISVLGGRGTGSRDGGETQVFNALDTATRTASVNAAADMYAKLDGPPRARPRIVPDLSAMTADVLEPPQSTQRKSDMMLNIDHLVMKRLKI
jgi:hypothetical protein